MILPANHKIAALFVIQSNAKSSLPQPFPVVSVYTSNFGKSHCRYDDDASACSWLKHKSNTPAASHHTQNCPCESGVVLQISAGTSLGPAMDGAFKHLGSYGVTACRSSSLYSVTRNDVVLNNEGSCSFKNPSFSCQHLTCGIL